MRNLAVFGIVIYGLQSCYHLPVWKGDVQVHSLERKAVEKCGDGALTAEGGKRISRQPYIQSTTTTGTIVAWGSSEARGSVVLTEPGGDVIQTITGVYAGDPEHGSGRIAAQHAEGKQLEPRDIIVMKAEFAGLQPTHLYCYQIIDEGYPLTALAPLTTAAAPGLDEPQHFVAVGDTGTGGAAAIAIAKRMSEVPFDFMLFLGDIAYEQGTAAQLEHNFFAVYKDFLRSVPVYTTLGNHERRTKKGRPYFEAFVLPEPERYYSFDWGDVHFVAIDTTRRDDGQLTWLDADLARNKLPWVIVFGHHPPYTNSLRGPQMWIRRAFSKIFTDHHVDIVLNGHEHQYERFRVAGVNYVVSGGGGGQLTHFFGRSRAIKQATVHHFLAFEVTAKQLEMKAIDIQGRTIETMKLSKNSKNELPKVKVDEKPETKTTPIAPETQTKPDEKLHDEPDDDTKQPKNEP